MKTVQQLIIELSSRLCTVCTSQAAAKQEAWWIVEHVLGVSQASLLGDHKRLILPDQEQHIHELVEHRVISHKPLQYLIGWVPFINLSIEVRPPILIPRPETEEWVVWLVQQLAMVAHQPLRILDMCTGTGCIALALAKACPKAIVVGVDINPQAVDLAINNAQRNQITNATFIQSDLFQALGEQQPFDLIVSNPPYITSEEFACLSPEVSRWEDRQALVAAEDGLAIYQRLLADISSFLSSKGILTINHMPCMVVEVGNKLEAVVALLHQHGFSKVIVHSDLQGIARWIAVYN